MSYKSEEAIRMPRSHPGVNDLRLDVILSSRPRGARDLAPLLSPAPTRLASQPYGGRTHARTYDRRTGRNSRQQICLLLFYSLLLRRLCHARRQRTI